MAQKIIQVGNSIGVTIPRDFAEDAGFKPGQQVQFEGNIKTHTFIVKKIQTYKHPPTQELHEWLEKFNKKYKKGLTELAKK